MNKFITLSHLRRVISAITNRFKSLENTVEDIEETKADISYVDSKPGVMKVTVTGDEDNGYSADKTFAEIYAHIQNGGSVYMHYEGTAYKLLSYGSENITFSSGAANQGYDSNTYKHTLHFPMYGINPSNTVYSIPNNIIYMDDVTLNGSTNYSPSFYAPTTVGTSGQVLTSSGSGAPTWSNISTPSAATATPLMDGTAAVGSSSKYAKEDHVHPSDTSKLPIRTMGSGGTQEAIFTNGGTYWRVEQIGSGDSTSRASINGSGGTVTLSSSTGSGSNATNNIISITPSTTSISKIPTPTGDTDAANKKYVDDKAPLMLSAAFHETQENTVVFTGATPKQVAEAFGQGKTVYAMLDEHILLTLTNCSIDSYTYDGYYFCFTTTIASILNPSFYIIKVYIDMSSSSSDWHGEDTSWLSRDCIISNYYVPYLGELEGVTLSDESDGQVLVFDEENYVWKNATIPTGATYTLSMTNNVITLTGSDGSTSSVTLPVYGGEVDAVWEGGSY